MLKVESYITRDWGNFPNYIKNCGTVEGERKSTYIVSLERQEYESSEEQKSSGAERDDDWRVKATSCIGHGLGNRCSVCKGPRSAQTQSIDSCIPGSETGERSLNSSSPPCNDLVATWQRGDPCSHPGSCSTGSHNFLSRKKERIKARMICSPIFRCFTKQNEHSSRGKMAESMRDSRICPQTDETKRGAIATRERETTGGRPWVTLCFLGWDTFYHSRLTLYCKRRVAKCHLIRNGSR
jgi:hypothetical protein